eukprot:TRINITY_DN39687_c0_g1_i1.p1 TRINITY_DN39687_c0_g1~~TRINITY_DN39687_c0_g1_i1.p1  ORF type:complete len:297 (-),score=65.69 TRINITY_DN39687_c0_g1_i1:57-947(-)
MATPLEELKALGYEYNAAGRLVQVGSDKGFEFQDQAHYDKLADAVLRHVGTLLVDEAKLMPVTLPLGATSGPTTKIFVSEGYQAADKLLLMIQGSGRVRVGVWGCALCINKDLTHGTMLPYLQKAKEAGYGVIVLNPNENAVDGEPIPGCETADKQLGYVWENLIRGKCKQGLCVDIVAHSNGGRALLAFLADRSPLPAEALKQMHKIVLTDSYHAPEQVKELPPEAQAVLADASKTVNYVPSPAPAGEPVQEWQTLGYVFKQSSLGCACISSAAPDHASTNQASLNLAFDFFSKS